jgi:hypothetical protein
MVRRVTVELLWTLEVRASLLATLALLSQGLLLAKMARLLIPLALKRTLIANPSKYLRMVKREIALTRYHLEDPASLSVM